MRKQRSPWEGRSHQPNRQSLLSCNSAVPRCKADWGVCLGRRICCAVSAEAACHDAQLAGADALAGASCQGPGFERSCGEVRRAPGKRHNAVLGDKIHHMFEL